MRWRVRWRWSLISRRRTRRGDGYRSTPTGIGAGAEASYRRALELAPGNARVVNVAGALAMTQGRLEEALGLYRQALEQDPLRPAAHSNLANTLRLVGRFAEAEVAYRKALELAPQRAGVHGKLSLNLLAQGRGARGAR